MDIQWEGYLELAFSNSSGTTWLILRVVKFVFFQFSAVGFIFLDITSDVIGGLSLH